jgi:type I restriction enzyme, R subunit
LCRPFNRYCVLANTGESEADTGAKYIDPELAAAGLEVGHVMREYYFTGGQKLAAGQRGTRCFIDYLLRISLA